MSNPGRFKAAPTIAAGDWKVSKDFGAFANLATLPSVAPAAGRQVQIDLSATEMNADNICVLGVDQTDPPEWADVEIQIQTTAATGAGANLTHVMGTALTEGAAGRLAGGIVKWFNVASPTGTVNSIPDAVAGAAGGLFIAGTNAATEVTTSFTTTFTGNLTGSVGSVTGAVGSVTGNVGGNVAGSVGSVTGAVGSVTGNVGGNLVGSVGTFTAAALAQMFTLDSGTTFASAVAGSVVKEIVDNAGGGSAPTVQQIVDGVFDEAAGVHTGWIVGLATASALSTVAGNVTSILADTGTDGVVVNTFTVAGKAELQAEAADALNAYDPPTNAEMEARTLPAASYATAANQTTILARLGGWAGSARNTILGALQALFRKDADATVPSDINADLGGGVGTADNTTDSLQAIRDRGDISWITATGFSTHTAADVWTVATRALTDKAGFTISGTVTTLDALNTSLSSVHGAGSWATATGFSTLTQADIRTAVGLAAADLDAQLAAILADTNELQTDWTNGGRLDLLIDAIKAVTDKLDTALELDGAVYRYTVNALELAPTGGSAPTAADNAAAVMAATADGVSVADWLTILGSTVAGVAARTGSDVVFKARDGTTTVITITYGAVPGDRTASVIA